MVEEDRERFVKLMATLAEVYGECSVLKQQAYWMALNQYEWPDVEFAAMRCIRTRQSSNGYPGSWPTPGDLIALMWNDLDAIPNSPAPAKQKALPLPRTDPKTAKKYLAEVNDMLSALSNRLPKMPSVPKPKKGEPYGEVLQRERWFMQEHNWRARWDLAKVDPEYRVLLESIPERLRVKFADEDRQRSEERSRDGNTGNA